MIITTVKNNSNNNNDGQGQLLSWKKGQQLFLRMFNHDN